MSLISNKLSLTELMRRNAESVSAIVKEIKNWEEAIIYVVDVTLKQVGKVIAAVGINNKFCSNLEFQCNKNGIKLETKNLRNSLDLIHTGFTTVDYGIAETGTLVIQSNNEDVRIASMLSNIHIAVLPESKIRKRFEDITDELKNRFKNAADYTAFISGPSRTADIERVLTIGAHGPLELHILILMGN